MKKVIKWGGFAVLGLCLLAFIMYFIDGAFKINIGFGSVKSGALYKSLFGQDGEGVSVLLIISFIMLLAAGALAAVLPLSPKLRYTIAGVLLIYVALTFFIANYMLMENGKVIEPDVAKQFKIGAPTIVAGVFSLLAGGFSLTLGVLSFMGKDK